MRFAQKSGKYQKKLDMAQEKTQQNSNKFTIDIRSCYYSVIFITAKCWQPANPCLDGVFQLLGYFQ